MKYKWLLKVTAMGALVIAPFASILPFVVSCSQTLEVKEPKWEEYCLVVRNIDKGYTNNGNTHYGYVDVFYANKYTYDRKEVKTYQLRHHKNLEWSASDDVFYGNIPFIEMWYYERDPNSPNKPDNLTPLKKYFGEFNWNKDGKLTPI